MTLEEWQRRFEELSTIYNFRQLAIDWHGGQWSGLYRLQCNTRILNYEHACDVYVETIQCLRCINIGIENGIEAMTALRDICDIYPVPEGY